MAIGYGDRSPYGLTSLTIICCAMLFICSCGGEKVHRRIGESYELLLTHAFYPCYSMDNKRLVFASSERGRMQLSEILLFDMDTKHLTRITDNEYADTQPCFSFNGKMIAFTRTVGGKDDIYLHILSSNQSRRLTSFGGNYPAFTPDDKRVIFTSARNDSVALFEIDVLTGALSEVVSADYPCWYGRYSPDGRYLVFSVTENGNDDLYIKDLKNDSYHQVTFGDANDRFACFAPDSRTIYFSSDRVSPFGARGNNQAVDIWRLDIEDITKPKISRITHSHYNFTKNLHPAVSPDGQTLLFSTNSVGLNWGVAMISLTGIKSGGN